MRYPIAIIICALFGLAVSYQPQQASSQVELPSELVAVPVDAVEASPVPFVSLVQDGVCVDGSCSPAMSASGPVASVAQAVSGPVRRIVEKKPVRRVVGRVFSRIRGCR